MGKKRIRPSERVRDLSRARERERRRYREDDDDDDDRDITVNVRTYTSDIIFQNPIHVRRSRRESRETSLLTIPAKCTAKDGKRERKVRSVSSFRNEDSRVSAERPLGQRAATRGKAEEFHFFFTVRASLETRSVCLVSFHFSPRSKTPLQRQRETVRGTELREISCCSSYERFVRP